MRFSSNQVVAMIAALGLVAGCRNAQESATAPQLDADAIVARYSSGEIRRGEIREAVERRLARLPGPVAPEVRRLMVRRIIEHRVRNAAMLEEAKAKGYPERPAVRLLAQAAEERLLAADLVARKVESIQAADTLVAAEADRRLPGVRSEELRKFSHIFLRAPEGDAAARAKASASMQEILAEVKIGTGFNSLAERRSDSVMARGGGRIEWTRRKDLQGGAAVAIFALREGEVSQVVETKDGLHLFRLDGIRSSSPVDAAAVRLAVRKELDSEARAVAARGIRDQEVDATGVELASARKLERLSSAEDGWVARWKGGEVRASELLAVGARAKGGAAKASIALRELIENRLLAARRRAQGLTPELEALIAKARQDAILDVYRTALIAEIDTEPSADEIARFYRENGESALFLRDYRLDVLFFPQSGDSVADVYAAGEKVVAALRDGTRFDDLLDRPLRPDAGICRDAHAIDLDELRKRSLRLRKAVLNLAVGDITPALYLDAPQVVLTPKECVLEGRGVAFVRLREIRTLPLANVQGVIRAVLVKQKEKAGTDAIQARLIAASGLEILIPEG